MCLKNIVIRSFLFIVVYTMSMPSIGQETAPVSTDSTIARRDSLVFKEITLEDIHIEAVIEKPSVTLIPKKTETAVGEVPFNVRSFDTEIKARPKLLDEYGKELESAKRIEKIKKLLAKEDK